MLSRLRHFPREGEHAIQGSTGIPACANLPRSAFSHSELLFSACPAFASMPFIILSVFTSPPTIHHHANHPKIINHFA